MNKNELQTMLIELERYYYQIEAQKAEIDAELQLLKAYKSLFEDRESEVKFIN